MLCVKIQIIEDAKQSHSQSTGVLRGTTPFSKSMTRTKNTMKMITNKMLVSGNKLGISFILHCWIKISDWRNTTPRKYKPMPDLCTAGAMLYETAVIKIVPNVEINPIVKTAIENVRPAPIWESRITSRTMKR